MSKSLTQVERLANAVLALPQVQLETFHYFVDGMYFRMLARPKGTLICGKTHKKRHVYLVLSGTVAITNGDEPPREVTGPALIVSEKGTKRAVLALTDAICMTVHRTEETDLDKVETDLVEDDPRSPYLPGNTLEAPCALS